MVEPKTLSKTEHKRLARTLTEAEARHIADMRDFGKKELTGVMRDVYLKMEELHYQIDQMMYNLRLKLHQIEGFKQMQVRNKEQIESGEIWRHVNDYPHILLTKEELALENVDFELQVESSISNIRSLMANLLKYVGSFGVDKKVILTEEGYNELYDKVSKKVKELTGRDLLQDESI